MSRPHPIVYDKSVQWMVPRGWITIVTSISRPTYAQLVTVTSSLFPRAKNLLRSNMSKPDKPMTDVFNGNDSVYLGAQSQLAVIELKFRYCQMKLPKNSWQAIDGYKYESDSFKLLSFPKSSEAPQESADHATHIIFVENKSGSAEGSFNDMIVTVHFVKPPATDAVTPTKEAKYDLTNIQADILPGLPKALEYFYFFQILDVNSFRRVIKSFVIPNITTSDKIISLGTTLPPSGLPKPGTEFIGFNIAISSSGLIVLDLRESLHDESFHRGQLRDARDLGDDCTERGMPNWDSEFQQVIHGVFQVTAHDENKAQEFVRRLNDAFHTSIKRVLLFRASFRPPPETPNEHFGYRDGISKPEVEGVTFDAKRPMRFPGSPVVDMGLIVMGHEGDEDRERRPPWAIDGSFFVFRKLKSYVPEFNDFLAAEAPKLFPGLPLSKATGRLGARMFGRWKSGTPVVLAPDEDDPAIAKDNSRLNNFDYNVKDQGACPFSAHTRKSFPRSDMVNSKKHLFRRQGIPYGPELGTEEGHRTIQDRGLAFTAYQSSIDRGFKFVQRSFNDANFPPAKTVQPGHDPVLGSTGQEKKYGIHRFASGANPMAQTNKLSFPVQFVEARGGEYFFVPSIATLKGRIGL